VKIALLDVNVLLALAWPNHQHHRAATAWFVDNSRAGWATCALTQLGFVRLSSNPAYTENAVSPVEAADLLQQWTSEKHHQFWASPPADDPKTYQNSFGHGQVNDAWLVEVARVNKGQLVTFDRRITAHPGARTLVELILG
jgi:uncharacterized protein